MNFDIQVGEGLALGFGEAVTQSISAPKEVTKNPLRSCPPPHTRLEHVLCHLLPPLAIDSGLM